MTAQRPLLPVALTMGEPAGIGGEITLKAWGQHTEMTTPFFVIGDAGHLQRLAGDLGLKIQVTAIDHAAEAADVFNTALPVLNQPLASPSLAGKLNTDNGAAVMGWIEKAAGLAQAGKVSAVVTNPIHKKCLYDAGFTFPGHTEYLAALSGIKTPPVMMLASPKLRVVPVTIHVGLTAAIAALSTELIVTIATITAGALKTDFGIKAPRLAIAGLNPHAGEGGAMGAEEAAIITPAIAALLARGIDATGPWPPDTLFHDAARQGYDAAICMYHDQALIPIKTLDFDGAVNVTLGLPFVRTSPDHGTALDIAGTGKASAASLLAALEMASNMAKQRGCT